MFDVSDVQQLPGNCLRSLFRLFSESGPMSKFFTRKKALPSLQEQEGTLNQRKPKTPEYDDYRSVMQDW
jgi:hypothetical protein